jgi:hypothetical protein
VGKVSGEAKRRYFEKIKEYKLAVDQILQREKKLLETVENDELGAGYKKLRLVDESLNLVSYYVLMNNLSMSLLGVRNDAFLNDARKACYKAIIYLEEVVTGYLDVPYSDYAEQAEKIGSFDDENRWLLVRKLGFAVDAVKDGFGENSKWKWSFVEIEGRFATVAKNLLDLKNFVAKMDPREAGYESRMRHLNLVKGLLAKSADGYRQKYELSTGRIDDFKLAIRYLSALRRLNILLGDSTEAENIKKKIDVWKTKMDNDRKRQESSGTNRL